MSLARFETTCNRSNYRRLGSVPRWPVATAYAIIEPFEASHERVFHPLAKVLVVKLVALRKRHFPSFAPGSSSVGVFIRAALAIR